MKNLFEYLVGTVFSALILVYFYSQYAATLADLVQVSLSFDRTPLK